MTVKKRALMFAVFACALIAGCTAPAAERAEAWHVPWPAEGANAVYTEPGGARMTVAAARPMTLIDPAGEPIDLLPLHYRITGGGRLGGFTEFVDASGRRAAVASPCEAFEVYSKSPTLCGSVDKVTAGWTEPRAPAGLGAGIVWGRTIPAPYEVAIEANLLGTAIPIRYQATASQVTDCVEFDRTTKWEDVGGQYFGKFANPPTAFTMCAGSVFPAVIEFGSGLLLLKTEESAHTSQGHILGSVGPGWWEGPSPGARPGSPYEGPNGDQDPTILSGLEAFRIAREEAAKAGFGLASALWLRETKTLSYSNAELDVITHTPIGAFASRSVSVEGPDGRVLTLVVNKECSIAGCTATVASRNELRPPPTTMTAASLPIGDLWDRANRTLAGEMTIKVALVQSDYDQKDIPYHGSYLVQIDASSGGALGVPHSLTMHAQNGRPVRFSLPSAAAEVLMGITAEDLR